MEVHIEHVKAMLAYRSWINRMDLDDIQFMENEEPIDVDPKVMAEFKLCGLVNTDFIGMELYNKKGTMWDEKD